ncbi:MAG TPA: hypothetical protein VN772_02485 [Solirubrobacteraceae bacterium]|nr:hypothetical protein [Solirubrobacteraceae bacterium]
MSANGYRLLGFVVWHGARWYLRGRLPSARALLAGTVLLAALGGALAMARRAGG